jgi:hypothetical protein
VPDLSDVENALVALISCAAFNFPLATESGLLFVSESGQVIVLDPGGPGYLPGSLAKTAATWPQTFIATSGTITPGSPIMAKLYRGWPESSNLDSDLAAGNAHISVFPESGMTRNTTRYQDKTRVPLPTPTTLTATVTGQVVTFGGNCAAPHLAGVKIGNGLDTATYAYPTQPSDTPATVAAALAALIAGATVSGAVLTCPAQPVVARTGALQTTSFETRRQTQSFRLSFWCPAPLVRDVLVSAVDVSLSLVRRFSFLDGTVGRLIFQSVFVDDKPSKDRVWRRDLRVQVEYPTTAASLTPIVLFPAQNFDLNVQAGAAGAITVIS